MSRPFSILLAALFTLVRPFAAVGAEEIYPLTKLIIADTEEKALAVAPDAGGAVPVFVDGVPLFTGVEFERVVASHIGKPIGSELIAELMQEVTKHAQKQDRLIANVLIPQQDVRAGTLRFAVLVGRYNELMFQGNRWFSKDLLAERLGLKPGDEIRLSTLEEAVNWTNTNPFRQVKVLVNEIPNQPGRADLIVGVKERRPFRAAFSFDDTGNPSIGEYRYAASLQFGNLWGRDHMGSYQYLTSDDAKSFQAHAVDYRVPLRWRHFLQFNGSYLTSQPLFADGLLLQTAKHISANVRYTVPLRTGNEPRDLFFGATYKHGNSNLEFDPQLTRQHVFTTNTDTFQLFAGFSTLNRDKYGAWLFAATVYGSPGNINSRNTDEAFQAYGSRTGASASYVYGTLSAQRLHKLGESGWEIFSRGVLQAASHNMVQGEHLGIGGSSSVRGYDENIYAAEQGFIFTTDLMTPVWKQALPFLPKQSPPLETRFHFFYDAAQVEYKRRDPSDIPFAPLASAGVGFRTSLATNLNVSVDYAWQLTHLPMPPRSRSRGHVKVVLAF